jgi:hypothetical protein
VQFDRQLTAFNIYPESGGLDAGYNQHTRPAGPAQQGNYSRTTPPIDWAIANTIRIHNNAASVRFWINAHAVATGPKDYTAITMRIIAAV